MLVEELFGERFAFLEELGSGSQAAVFRVRYGEGVAALKIHHGGRDPRQSKLSARKEASWLACMQHELLPEILEVGQIKGHDYILMEFIEGQALSSVLEEGPLPEEDCIKLARQLAGMLQEIHLHGLVHRDIKPGNIVVDALQQAHLIDFGIAAKTGAHWAEEQDKASFAGNLHYASPEQSGMLARPVDARSDLYALGVVLFECLTGRLPFRTTREALHITGLQQAPLVHTLRAEVSEALSLVVARLLAQEPDDRYSSAGDLLLALAHLRELPHQKALQESGASGLLSHPRQLAELPLIGRAQELQELHVQWERVAQSQGGRYVLLEGAPGEGKSRLVREFLRQLSGPSLCMGKCVERSQTSLHSLKQALEQYFDGLLLLPAPRRLAIEAQLRQELLPLAVFLHDLSPRLQPLLPMPSSSARDEESWEHFHTAIASLFVVLARASQGLVLFLDDVQWLDISSLEVIRHLVVLTKGCPLLLLATSRDDPESLDGRRRFQASCAAALLYEIELLPMTRAEVGAATQSILHRFAPNQALVDFLYEKSKGNPFFFFQLLRALLDEGMLYPSKGQWTFEEELLEQMQLPDDIVSIVLFRMEQLSPKAKEVLSFAAILDYEFLPSLLIDVAPFSEEEVVQALTEGIANQLIERTRSGYRFVHDRVHEAMQRSTTPEEQRQIHLQIAQALEQMPAPDPAQIFACALHYDRADDPAHARAIFSNVLRAGQLALHSFEEERAFGLLERALARAMEAEIEPPFALYHALLIAGMRLNRVRRIQPYFDKALVLAPTPTEKAHVYGLLGEAHLSVFRYSDAEAALSEGLRALRDTPPQASARSLWSTWWMWVTCLLISWLVRRPRHSQEVERRKVLCFLYDQLNRVYYFQLRDVEILEVWVRQFSLLRGQPDGKEKVKVYSTFSALLGLLLLPSQVRKYNDIALEYAKGDPHLSATAKVFRCFGLEFTGRIPDTFRLSMQTMQEHGDWLSPFEWINGHNGLGWALMSRGLMEEAEFFMLRTLKKITHDDESETSYRPMATTLGCLAVALHSMGRLAEAQNHIQKARAITSEDLDDNHTRSFVIAAMVWMYLEAHDFGPDFDALCDEHDALQLTPWRVPMYLKYYYAFAGMARVHQCRSLPKARRSEALERCRKSLKSLKQVAMLPVFQVYYHYVKGSLALLEGETKAAQRELDKAHSLALEWENPLMLCEIACQRARIAQGADQDQIASGLAHYALSLCQRHRWSLRQRRIHAEFLRHIQTHLPGGTQLSSSSTFTVNDLHSAKFSRQLHALLQINLASATLRMPHILAQTVLDELIHLLGAERGFLYLRKEGHLERSAARNPHTVNLDLQQEPHTPMIDYVEHTQKSVVLGGGNPTAIFALARIAQSMEEQGIKSAIAAPLLMHGQLLGVCYLDNRLIGGLFDQGDADILQALANHIAVAFYVTESRQLLSQARDEALKADHAKSLFLATIGHELRTPLNAILGYTELLLEDDEIIAVDNAAADLSAIQTSGTRLLNIIVDVLAYTDLETTTFVPTLSTFLVIDLLKEVEANIEALLHQNKNQIKVNCPTELLHTSDRDVVFRLLSPICQNAAQFTNHGTITFSVSQTEAGMSYVVKDTGAGMAEEVLSMIFHPFYQADMSHSREHAGIGMGLALSQRFAQALGGRITVASQPGQGTEVRVVLPPA